MAVDDTLGVLAGTHESEKAIEQAGRSQGLLAGVRVDVEQSTLRPRGGRWLGFVNRDGDAVAMEDAGERQASQARADDGNRVSHVHAPLPAGRIRDAAGR